MLDSLPAWLRHLLVLAVIAPLAGFVSAELVAVVQAGGLTTVPWADTTRSAFDAAGVTAASGLLAWLGLFVTPLTRQYGVGQDEPAARISPDETQD